jgi:hypothetical protein
MVSPRGVVISGSGVRLGVGVGRTVGVAVGCIVGLGVGEGVTCARSTGSPGLATPSAVAKSEIGATAVEVAIAMARRIGFMGLSWVIWIRDLAEKRASGRPRRQLTRRRI